MAFGSEPLIPNLSAHGREFERTLRSHLRLIREVNKEPNAIEQAIVAYAAGHKAQCPTCSGKANTAEVK